MTIKPNIIVRYSLISGITAFIGSKLGGLYIDYLTPDFFQEIHEQSKADENLMQKIGGYKTFEYHFNENEIKGDSMNFKIIIKGFTKDLVYTGFALRSKYTDWKIKRITKSFE